MATRTSNAVWTGKLKTGRGTMKTGSGALDARYSAGSRFENEQGTNPEELIGAAHAGCFSMALANELDEAGYEPKEIKTTAEVRLDKIEGGFKISSIRLKTEAKVDGADNAAFQEIAGKAKTGCPVSEALKSVPIELDARLI